jgi:hypothetical protein
MCCQDNLDEIALSDEEIENQKEDTLLKEIMAVTELERYLSNAIIDRNSLITLPSEETETFMQDQMKYNPMWYYNS